MKVHDIEAGSEAGEAGDDLGIRVGLERRDGGGFEFIGSGAGRVELSEQGLGFGAHGLFDQWRLLHLGFAQQAVEAFDFGGDLALTAGLDEQGPQSPTPGPACRWDPDRA
ncbi:hypothetical protein [Actinacidiphila sp. bgisy160]|uniref:hypothetical protein n=1 Tax=Actinacidiphila sp. bgisy160 TaxID=3413796 RepID=UPI003D7492CD